MGIVPRNREEIRINPLDLVENNKVAVGVTLPFNGYAVFNQSFTKLRSPLYLSYIPLMR